MVSDPNTSATAEPPPSGKADSEAGSAAADFENVKQRLEELGRYLGHYLTVKRDRLLRKVQRSLVLLAGIAVAAVVVLAFLATAGVLLCVGIALALNAATGSTWMGPLFTGLVVLLLLAGGTFWAMRRVDRLAMKRFSQRCQTRRAELRLRYGRGIDE
jgi:tetrahydromethanopterin S-methyltransferase subunit G